MPNRLLRATVRPDHGAPTARHAGRDVLDQLAADADQAMPRTWTVSTPSGGQHLYYRQPDGTELGSTAGPWLEDSTPEETRSTSSAPDRSSVGSATGPT